MALNYGSVVTPTCTSFDGLGYSITTGFASCAKIDTSTTNNVVDYMVRVRVTAGALTGITAATMVVIYVIGSEDGTAWPGGTTGTEVFTDSSEANTLSATSNNMRFLGTINMHTASIVYNSEPMSIAAAFGGFLPRKFKIVIQNQSSASVALGGSSLVSATSVYYN